MPSETRYRILRQAKFLEEKGPSKKGQGRPTEAGEEATRPRGGPARSHGLCLRANSIGRNRVDATICIKRPKSEPCLKRRLFEGLWPIPQQI